MSRKAKAWLVQFVSIAFGLGLIGGAMDGGTWYWAHVAVGRWRARSDRSVVVETAASCVVSYPPAEPTGMCA